MVSARRNELLAELFQRSHRIEKRGRGIKMILEREPLTEFEEIGITADGIKYHLARLRKQGVLKRVGPDIRKGWGVTFN